MALNLLSMRSMLRRCESMRKMARLLGVLQPWFRTRTGSEWHLWKARAKLYKLFCYRRCAGEGKASESGPHSVLGVVAGFCD